jgi:mycothiol synthase
VSIEVSFDRRPLSPDQSRSWAELVTAIQVADHDSEIQGEDDLLEEFADPLCDFERGSVALYDGEAMVGYSVIESRNVADPVHAMRLHGGVHPGYRGLGIGSVLLDWSERTATELHRERFAERPVSLSAQCLAKNISAMAFFADRGYQQTRWFHEMMCDLSADLPPAIQPESVATVGFADDRSADALLVRNEAFRDHWGSTVTTQESWTFYTSAQAFRPAYSFLSYLAGEPVGVLLSYEYDAYNEATGTRDLYVALVGTRRIGRKRGIASALLVTALRAAKADGFDTSTLTVDADSPTGAVGLYERLGFAVHDTRVTQRKLLDDPAQAA